MMNRDIPEEILTAFEMLKEYMLANFPDAKLASGKSEITKRCHLCGDSRDPTQKHMYIGINKKIKAICYHCFKCSGGGVVDAKFFRDLGVYDVDLINSVIRANNSVFKGIPTAGSIKSYRRQYAVPKFPISGDDRTVRKLAYVNRRLGLQLSFEGFGRLKIIPNIVEYLQANEIGYFSRNPDIMKELDLGFLGFLSADNSHIVLRRLVPENKVHPNISDRYVNYNIFPNYVNGITYYVIPGQITNQYRPCHIYLSEGPFDILSIYHNVPLDHENAIFAAACGKGYIGLINYILININFPVYGLDIHIFSDNDVKQRELNNIKAFLDNLVCNYTLHFNLFEGEKDFGVPFSNIIDGSTQIKKNPWNIITNQTNN